MAQPRAHLSRAPLVEALLDFKVEPRADIQPGDFIPLANELDPQFPQRARTTAGEVQFGPGPDGIPVAAAHGQRTGELLRSEDGKVVQLRTDGFTFSKMRPYSSWAELAPEAIALWARYLDVARPVALRRLAVRYINALELPLANLDQYLTTPPAAPPPTPRLLKEFLSRVVVWDQETAATAIITLVIPPMMVANQMGLILDIDVFSEANLILDPSANRGRLDQLRTLKNDIFFASLTDAAVAQFE